jgi:hypothetical protein
MPQTIDSAGSLNQIPSLHSAPSSGEGSKTPPDPNKLGPPTPIGGAGGVKPAGAPGAPTGGGAATDAGTMAGLQMGAGAKKPALPSQDPEKQLNDKANLLVSDTIEKLRHTNDETKELIDRAKKRLLPRDKEEELIDLIADSLLNEGFKPYRIQDLQHEKGFDSFSDYVMDIIQTNQRNLQKEEKQTQLLQGLPPITKKPAGKEGNPPLMEKKPDNDTMGVNPPKAAQSNTSASYKDANFNRSVLMKKQVELKDGTLVLKEATDVSNVIEGISIARRKVEALLEEVQEGFIKQAGIEALIKQGELGMPGGMGMPGGGMGAGPMAPGAGGLDAIIGKLKDAIQALADFLGKGSALKKDETIPKKDFDDLEGEMGKGKATMDKALPVAKGDVKPFGGPKKEEPKPFGGPAPEKKEVAAGSEELTKEAAKDSQKAMDVAMGKVGPEKKKEDKKDDKKEDKKEEKKDDDKTKKADDGSEEGSEASEEGVGDEKKEEEEADKSASISAQSIVSVIKERLAMTKEAQLYPFKDLNKQKVDNINATTAKQQASTINSEISGGKHPEGERAQSIAPKSISETARTPEKGKCSEKGKVSVEVAERIRQSTVQNEISKARLAVELASQQQLKGLIPNPLKEAFVANMVNSGINKEAAEDIAHNSFVDGYEQSQKEVMKEAFDTFMGKDVNDFIKVAKYTKEFKVKEGSQESSETVTASQEVTREKTASVKETPLRGTQASKDRREDYRNYWEDVSRDDTYNRKRGY